jgi:carbamoyl-phosphate synthase small subunit
VVFTTAMMGYQEILTDPSYAGQIVTFTYPLIGNVGVNAVDMEAERPHCRGLVLRRLSRRASNHRAEGELGAWLVAHGLVAIEGIDTRALTRHIRLAGAMRGALASGEAAADLDALVEEARGAPRMEGQDLTAGVTITRAQRFHGGPGRRRVEVLDGTGDAFAGGSGPRIAVLDLGVKQGILDDLVAVGARVVVLPARTEAAQILDLQPDGVLLSNGPGDPAAVDHGIRTVERLLGRCPLLGICLGHQLLALALGLRTRKLGFGHHGANHPVRDLDTGRVLVTAQNHGFAVEAEGLPDAVRITHRSLVDGTVEGLAAPALEARSIQFHPEASPGPHDARNILSDFVNRSARTVCRPALISAAS